MSGAGANGHRRSPRVLISVCSMVTGIGLALGTATSASAAPAPSSTVDEEGTIAHVVAKTTGDAGLQQQDIDCTLSIDNPHQSNTLPSTWNVHLDWKCTGAEPPASLSASPRLYRNGQIVDEPSPTVNHGKRKLRAVANTQCEILQVRTTTPARCYFALWEGYGDLAEHHREAASFTTPARRWYLHTARVADAVAGFDTVTGVNTKPPDLWWPEDKRWFVGGDTDLPCVYVGCTSNTAAELLRSRLEAFTVEPTDPPRG